MTYDTLAEGLLRSDNDQEYREEMEEMTVWCGEKKTGETIHSFTAAH